MNEKQRHSWTPSIRNQQPILKCTNEPCRIVWWPTRSEPKSACTGKPGADRASEFVRALIAGGGL